MITKEKFIEVLAFLKKKQSQENRFCELLEEMVPDTFVHAFVYADFESELVKLLKIALDLPDENDDIEYFLYELDFGKDYKPGTVTEEDGTEIDMSSPEKLYNYLVKIKK